MQTGQKVRVHIRWMIRRDMPEVLAIEAASFPCPWGEEAMISKLRQRDTIGMVAEADGKVVGYMVYRLGKRFILLPALAVHPDWRRRFIGTQMAAKLAGKLDHRRRRFVELMARESNLEGLGFLKHCGYRALKVAREHFADTGEDGYVMQYHLPPEPAAAAQAFLGGMGGQDGDEA